MTQATVADARNHLPRLIHQAEHGEPIHITRHGRPVVVLLAEREYTRLTEGRTPQQGFLDFLQQWRARMATDDCVSLSEQEVDALGKQQGKATRESNKDKATRQSNKAKQQGKSNKGKATRDRPRC